MNGTIQQQDSASFQSELNGSVDKIQTMIHHLGTVKDDIYNLQNEVDRHRPEQPMIYQIGTICARCTRDTLGALNGAGILRSKYQQLSYLFSNPQSSVSEARSLAFEIQGLSGSVFATVDSIKQSLDDIELHAKALQAPRKEPWWKRILTWIRDGLALVATITALVPGLNIIISAALACGASIASVTNTYLERRGRNSKYSGLQSAIEQTVATRQTLSGVMAMQPGLNQTTNQALSILDSYDVMQRMLAQQTNSQRW